MAPHKVFKLNIKPCSVNSIDIPLFTFIFAQYLSVILFSEGSLTFISE